MSCPVRLLNIQLQRAKLLCLSLRAKAGTWMSQPQLWFRASQLFELTENQAIISQTTNILHLIQSEMRDVFPFDSLGNRWRKLQCHTKHFPLGCYTLSVLLQLL